MKYYIQETVFDETRNRTAASKAREDVNEIVSGMGYRAVEVQYDYHLRKSRGLLPALIKLTKDWHKALNKVKKDDIVLIQFPLNHHPLGIVRRLNQLHKRGGKVILLIHDVDSLRIKNDSAKLNLKYRKIQIEDRSIIGSADVVIAHNDRMIEKLSDMGITKNKMISLEIFDYLLHGEIQDKIKTKDGPVIIAGTLRKGKAGYVYRLPRRVQFNLYGIGYEDSGQENTTYHGSFKPEDLPAAMEGSFGLVWDGESSQTCEGGTGRYLKINNPHKTSLYLVAGLPVIVWRDAAIADFIENHNVGISVRSLDDIPDAVNRISDRDYTELVQNAKKLSKLIKNGYHTNEAVKKAEALI